MRIAFGKKLRGIQRAPLLDNAVHEEVIFAPEQDHVPAAHILNGDPPDQGDILRPHPWLHAGAVNAQGNPATPLKRVGNSPRDRKSTRLNSSHITISYTVFCLIKKKKKKKKDMQK